MSVDLIGLAAEQALIATGDQTIMVLNGARIAWAAHVDTTPVCLATGSFRFASAVACFKSICFLSGVYISRPPSMAHTLVVLMESSLSLMRPEP